MTWVSVLGAILYYTAYPVTTLFWLGIRLLRLVLSPITAFFQFIIALISFPFKWLARFETVFVYLSFAALVGLVTGLILHVSSSFLVAVLNLNPVPELEEKGRTAASVRAAREQKALEDAWQTSSLNQQPDSKSGTDSLEERYAQWLEKDAGRAKRNVGLFGQTILEEDDSSMDGY